MLRNLPAPLIGLITSILLLANLLAWTLPVYALILLKVVTWGRARKRVSLWIANCAQVWAAINVWLWDTTLGIEWDLRGVSRLRRDGQYLVTANHQTWNDIPVLMKVFDRRAPFFRFFIKQQLIWVPILGLVWWGLDFPFMKRHTPAQVAKNPKLRGRDLEATRRACEKYRETPVTILNFLEGTRFTPAKQASQGSPYAHLLKPRAGGAAFVLEAMGDKLDSVLDVTIAYPDGACGFWGLMSGRMRRVIVEVRELAVPAELVDVAAVGEKQARASARAWVDELWTDKDARIERMLAEANGTGRTREAA